MVTRDRHLFLRTARVCVEDGALGGLRRPALLHQLYVSVGCPFRLLWRELQPRARLYRIYDSPFVRRILRHHTGRDGERRGMRKKRMGREVERREWETGAGGKEGERERTQVEGVALPLGAPVEATARRSTGVTFGHPESSDFDDMMCGIPIH